MLFFSIKLSNCLVMNLGSPVMSLCCSSALMPSSCGVVVYKLFTSNDMRNVLSEGGMFFF